MTAGPTRVGLVVVSHSPALARAAVDLALAMVAADPPHIEVAAGTDDGRTGTDAVRVAAAIDAVAQGSAGVLVFMDLGSAVLSAELALDFCAEDVSQVRLTSAPFVEGLVAAVVTAAGGGSLADVEREARGALGAKRSQLDDEQPQDVSPAPVEIAGPSVDVTVINAAGLHARPAARLVALLGGRGARVTVQNLTRGSAAVPLTGTTALLTIGGRQGERLRFTASGADASDVLRRVAEAFADGFGEPVESAEEPESASAVRSAGPVLRMPPAPAPPGADRVIEPARREAEAARIAPAAAEVARAHEVQATTAPEEIAAILRALGQLCLDPALTRTAAAHVIDEGITAERAVWETFTAVADQLRGQCGPMAERAADLRDLAARVVAELDGSAMPRVPTFDGPHLLLAHSLAPADAATLDPGLCVGLVLETGGPSSHTALIVSALGIPTVFLS